MCTCFSFIKFVSRKGRASLTWLNFMILVPILFAIFVPIIHKFCAPRLHTGWFVLFVPLTIFIFLIQYLPQVGSGNTLMYLVPWIPSFGINYTTYVDGLSLLFGLLITGVGTLVILYSIYYMSKFKEALHNFYVYLLLFMSAMLGLVFSDNVFVLYVFWELTSISSFLLIAYWFQRKSSRYGALKSMLITIFGGLAMLAGFIMLSIITDTFSIREMISQSALIGESGLFLPALILILLGAFTKSAQFPFSIWLPDAMEAPTPVSAYLHSATMVKAGIYLIARFTPIFGGHAEWFWIVTGIGLFTLLYGSVNAVNQKDLKALLAYSTISQLGLITSLLGLGSAALYFGHAEGAAIYGFAVLAALFHLLNHSTFKGSLFMIVGIIDLETGTRDVRRLGGLMSLMPISFTLTVIGGLSMAGLPPFNGFLSKEMFLTAMLAVLDKPVFGIETIALLFPIVAWIASVFTFIYCMILIFETFTGEHHPDRLDKKPAEPAIGMLVPPIILGLFVVGIFFFPNVVANWILQPALMAVLPNFVETNGLDYVIAPWHGWSTELFMTIGIIAIGFLLFRSFGKWGKIYQFYPQALTLNQLYNVSLEGMESASKKVTNRYMTGSIRTYLIYIFSFLILVTGGSLFFTNGLSIDSSNDSSISSYEVVIIFGMIVSILIILFAKSRVTSVIALGVLGYLVALLFVIFRAPDLALTQLVIETVTAALFLLCFYFLPELRREFNRLHFKMTNFIISIGVGAIVTLMALFVNNENLFESISRYFENAYSLAGAKNIVNAILVDFRGIDTMLEILVLCISGLGVYTLIKLQLAGREKK